MPKVKYNPTTKQWDTLEPNSPNGIYIDGYLRTALDKARHIIKKDWDMIFVYDGYEGSGKSVKCQQDAYYCDPTLNLDRITFNADDFKEAIHKANKYEAIILDEAYSGLSARGAMTNVNRAVVQMLTVIREKNLFIFIVLPSFFDLDRYVALWRSRALINVWYEKGTFKRGFFSFYNNERKKDLYINGKQTYNYKCVKANFFGRFMNGYVVDEKLYREKKTRTSVDPKNFNQTTVKSVAKNLRQTMARNLKDKDLGLTQRQIASIIGVTDVSICNYLKKPI